MIIGNAHSNNSELLFFILIFLLLFYDSSSIGMLGRRPVYYAYAALKDKSLTNIQNLPSCHNDSILFFILIFLKLFYK